MTCGSPDDPASISWRSGVPLAAGGGVVDGDGVGSWCSSTAGGVVAPDRGVTTLAATRSGPGVRLPGASNKPPADAATAAAMAAMVTVAMRDRARGRSMMILPTCRFGAGSREDHGRYNMGVRGCGTTQCTIGGEARLVHVWPVKDSSRIGQGPKHLRSHTPKDGRGSWLGGGVARRGYAAVEQGPRSEWLGEADLHGTRGIARTSLAGNRLSRSTSVPAYGYQVTLLIGPPTSGASPLHAGVVLAVYWAYVHIRAWDSGLQARGSPDRRPRSDPRRRGR